jgi:hypothetical protein
MCDNGMAACCVAHSLTHESPPTHPRTQPSMSDNGVVAHSLTHQSPRTHPRTQPSMSDNGVVAHSLTHESPRTHPRTQPSMSDNGVVAHSLTHESPPTHPHTQPSMSDNGVVAHSLTHESPPTHPHTQPSMSDNGVVAHSLTHQSPRTHPRTQPSIHCVAHSLTHQSPPTHPRTQPSPGIWSNNFMLRLHARSTVQDTSCSPQRVQACVGLVVSTISVLAGSTHRARSTPRLADGRSVPSHQSHAVPHSHLHSHSHPYPRPRPHSTPAREPAPVHFHWPAETIQTHPNAHSRPHHLPFYHIAGARKAARSQRYRNLACSLVDARGVAVGLLAGGGRDRHYGVERGYLQQHCHGNVPLGRQLHRTSPSTRCGTPLPCRRTFS